MIEDKVKNFFSGYAADFDSIYGDGKKRNRFSKFFDKNFRSAMFGRYKKTIDFIEKNNVSSVLDIGCGVATKLMNVIQKKSSKVFGIDQPSAIDFAKKIHCYENFYSCNFLEYMT